MNKIKTSLLGIVLIALSSCGMSDADKKEIATQACEIIGKYAHPSDRIYELNKARVKLGENELKVYDVSDVNFRNTDAMIKDSIKYSLCNDLVLNKSIDERLQQERNAEQAIKLKLEEEERQAIKKAKEMRRLAREKQQAEEKRLAEEKQQAERKALERRVSQHCQKKYAEDRFETHQAFNALYSARPKLPDWVLKQELENWKEWEKIHKKNRDECVRNAVNQELTRIATIKKKEKYIQDNADKIIDECVGLPAEQFKQCLKGNFVSKEKRKKYKSND